MDPIESKVKNDILRYLVSAERHRSWPPLWIYTLYSYLGEVFILLAGIGIANPVLNYLNNDADSKREAGRNALIPFLVKFLKSDSAVFASLFLLVVWGLIKFYIRTEDLEKRCNLLRSCMTQCKGFSVQLHQALAEADPMPKLIVIQQKLSDLVERNVIERAWIFAPFAPGIGPAVDKECADLVGPYRGKWSKFDADDRRHHGER